MIHHHKTRRGMSLTEVLVALFVMALGMISILTLFPLGASKMAIALRNNRTSQTATQADGMMRLWWQREVVERPGNEDPMFYVMDNPNETRNGLNATPYAVPPGAGLTPIPTDSTQPSYPVMIDPIGFQARTGSDRFWVASNNFPRRTARALYGGSPTSPNLILAFGACSLLDDITFGENGLPDTTSATAAPNTITREGRYNWSAVVQRQNNNLRTTANLTILVFDRRPIGTAPANSETVIVAPTFNVGSQQLSIAVAVGAEPPIRAGSWIMDGTRAGGIHNANFYRIKSIAEDSPTPGVWTLDLETPIKRPTGSPTMLSYQGQLYVLQNALYRLADVFERPQLQPSGYQFQTP